MSSLAIVFRATAGALAALPAEHVMETMRPLACAAIEGAPDFVTGAAVVRGRATPVIDVATMLGERGLVPTRWITVKAGARVVALAVAEVIGVRRLAELATDAPVPPLFTTAARGAIDALAVIDGELLVVLRAARLLDDEVWASFEKSTAPGFADAAKLAAQAVAESSRERR